MINLTISLPISKHFIEAVKETGIKETNDFNGADQEGVGFYQVNIKSGKDLAQQMHF